jgi:hypothetical protein
VYFDKGLEPRVLEPTDWFVRVDSRKQNLDTCLARVDRVQLHTTVGELNIGPDVVSYLGGIAQLRDEDGLDVEPFFGFPITRT